MKLILIEPNIEGRVSEPPINISLLKSFINEKTEHNAKIIDLTFHKNNWKSYIKNEIKGCDLIGISCLSFNYHQALKIASFLKESFRIKIIFGGIHVILAPEQVIENDAVDIVCTGEGEYVLKDLLDNGLDCKDIEGIWYKKNGKIIKNKKRRLIENLDDMPFPDWDDYDLEKYFRININHLGMTASRGCPYRCTFCASHALEKKMDGKWVRFRSPNNVIEEMEFMIEKYYKKGLRYFNFHDSTFNVKKDFVMEFCKKYTEKGLNEKFLWTAGVRVNLLTEEIVKTMSEAGCYHFSIGIESVNDYIRNVVYKKDVSKQQILDTVEWTQKYGIQIHASYIIGSPYDTLEIMQETLDFAKKINTKSMVFPSLMPLPSTEIREICIKEGLIEEKDFKSAHMMHTKPVAKTKYVSREEVQRFVKKIRRFVMKKYFLDGLKMKGIVFLFDLFVFHIYWKPKFKLVMDNAWKFTINRYNVENQIRERCIE